MRQGRLGDQQLADHVGIQLAPQLIGAQQFQGAGHADSGVVHQAPQRLFGAGLVDTFERGSDRSTAANIQADRFNTFDIGEYALDVACRGEDTKAVVRQHQGGGMTQAAGGTGNEYGFLAHDSSLSGDG